MGQIEFDVPDDVEEAFRRTAMERFGYERGSLTRAGEEALREWTDARETMGTLSVPDSPVAAIRGQLADVEEGSVELQESIGGRMADDYVDDEADSEC